MLKSVQMRKLVAHYLYSEKTYSVPSHPKHLEIILLYSFTVIIEFSVNQKIIPFCPNLIAIFMHIIQITVVYINMVCK